MSHFHTTGSGELVGVLISSDPWSEIEPLVMADNLRAMQLAVGGPVEEKVTPLSLECGCRVAMLINEMPAPGTPENVRASHLWHRAQDLSVRADEHLMIMLRGEAILLGSGPVRSIDGEASYDFFGIPREQLEMLIELVVRLTR